MIEYTRQTDASTNRSGAAAGGTTDVTAIKRNPNVARKTSGAKTREPGNTSQIAWDKEGNIMQVPHHFNYLYSVYINFSNYKSKGC